MTTPIAYSPAKRNYLQGAWLLFLLAIATVVLAIVLSAANYRFISDTWSLVALSIGGLTILAWIIRVEIRKKDFDPLEISFPIMVYFVLNYPLRALFIKVFPDVVAHPYNWPYNSEGYVSFALALALVGILCFYVGYSLNMSDHLLGWMPSIPFNWTDKYLTLKITILYGLGLLGLILLNMNGQALRFQWNPEVGAYDYPLQLLSSLRLFALFLMWANLKHKGKSSLLVPLGMLFAEIVIGLYLGAKSQIVWALVAVIFAYHYVLHRNILKIFLPVASVLILVLFPLVQVYRDVYRDTQSFLPSPSLEDLTTVSNRLPVNLSHYSADQWASDALIYSANRLGGDLDYLTMVSWWVPGIMDYQHGDTIFIPLIQGLVPRFLWADKPILSLGGIMAHDIMGLPSNIATNNPLTEFGELYLNFGVLGVPIGMFLVGIILRSAYVYIRRSNDSPITQALLYYAYFPSMVVLISSTGLGVTILGWTRLALVMFAVLFFCSLGGRPRLGIPSGEISSRLNQISDGEGISS